MKTIGNVLLLVCAVLLLNTLSVAAQDKKEEAPKLDAIHEHMGQCAGEYTTVTRFTAKAGDAPMESKGTAKITSILGGRFLQEEDTGTMFNQPFKSLKLSGYNSAAERFEASWVYTGSTSIMTLTGTSSDGGKTINWVGTYEEKKGQKNTLYVDTKHLNKNQIVMEMYSKNPDGSRGPCLETTYTRKK